MTPNLTLLGVGAILIATGVYLMMERSLTRVLVGVLLASNGVNVLFLVAAGRAGKAPFIGTNPQQEISDPLPMAMVLTAIVITLGLTAFLLTMAYRSFQLNGHDEVQDDVEDNRIRELAESDAVSASYDEDDHSLPSEDDSEPVPEEGADPVDAAAADPDEAQGAEPEEDPEHEDSAAGEGARA